jgi:hypothetical protein
MAKHRFLEGLEPLIYSTPIPIVQLCSLVSVVSEKGKRNHSNLPVQVTHAELSAECLSVDLTAANFVHLVEPHWNPMVEAQVVDRVHRIGQERDVITIRYITKNSIETVCRPTELPESNSPLCPFEAHESFLVRAMDPEG